MGRRAMSTGGSSEGGATLRFFDPDESGRRKKKKVAPNRPVVDETKLTEDALREAALSYLDKRDASVDQLRRVLLRRVLRYAPEGAREAPRERIEALLRRFGENGLLDDQRYAQTLTDSLRRRGDSGLKIRTKLRSRGVDATHIEEVLSASTDASEVESARAYVRRRRLLDRYDLSDPKQRQKALSSLARQGFSFDTAKRALGL